mgnify:CR=1 FL=1
MKMSKSMVMQIVMGSISLVMLVLSILCVGKIIPTAGQTQWAWGVMVISTGFVLVQVLVYFLLGKTEVMGLICKWLVVLFGVIILVINILILVLSASTIFQDFASGWLQFVLVLINFALCAVMITYLVMSDKEQKLAKQEKIEEKAEVK